MLRQNITLKLLLRAHRFSKHNPRSTKETINYWTFRGYVPEQKLTGRPETPLRGGERQVVRMWQIHKSSSVGWGGGWCVDGKVINESVCPPLSTTPAMTPRYDGYLPPLHKTEWFVSAYNNSKNTHCHRRNGQLFTLISLVIMTLFKLIF